MEVYQVVNYDYRDPDGVYENLLEDEKALQKELEMIHSNMATFLEAEKVYINKERVEQKIVHVDIGIRGTPEIVYFQWVIFFQGITQKGENLTKHLYNRNYPLKNIKITSRGYSYNSISSNTEKSLSSNKSNIMGHYAITALAPDSVMVTVTLVLPDWS